MKTDEELKQLAKETLKDMRKNKNHDWSKEIEKELNELDSQEEWNKFMQYFKDAQRSGFSYGFSHGVEQMFSPFVILDGKILAGCTKISHSIQRTVGITNYFIAKIGCAMSLISVALQGVNYFYSFLGFKTNRWLLFIDACWVVACLRRSLICTRAEDELLSGSNVKHSQILHYISPYFRIFWMIFCAITLPLSIGAVLISQHHVLRAIEEFGFPYGILIFYYFIAVDGLPPGISKVKAWIKKLFHVHVLQPVEDRG